MESTALQIPRVLLCGSRPPRPPPVLVGCLPAVIVKGAPSRRATQPPPRGAEALASEGPAGEEFVAAARNAAGRPLHLRGVGYQQALPFDVTSHACERYQRLRSNRRPRMVATKLFTLHLA